LAAVSLAIDNASYIRQNSQPRGYFSKNKAARIKIERPGSIVSRLKCCLR